MQTMRMMQKPKIVVFTKFGKNGEKPVKPRVVRVSPLRQILVFRCLQQFCALCVSTLRRSSFSPNVYDFF
jgi:hypothetical protein